MIDPPTPKQKAVREEMERLIAQTIFDGMGGGGGCDDSVAQMGTDIASAQAHDVMEALIQGPLKHWWVGLR